MTRLSVAAVCCLLVPLPTSAEPVRWGFWAVDGLAVDDGSNPVLAQQYGIAETTFSIGLLSRPVVPWAPTQADRDRGFYEPSATSAAKVTIIDEASQNWFEARITWTLGETWEYNAEGTWEPIATWENAGPLPRDAEWMWLGRHEYRVWSDGGPLVVNVRDAVTTPEPATLALAGLGLAAVAIGKRRRRG
jgi:hypothetical protein